MRKFFLLFILICFTTSYVFAFTIKGGISFSVNQARNIAFLKTPQKIDIYAYKNYFVDPNIEENLKALQKGKKKYKDRIISIFDDNSYGIIYKENKKIGYYYDNQGKLVFIEIKLNTKYPYTAAMYNIKGELENTRVTVTPSETFIFDTNKKLQSHWIGDNCYNEKGELIMTRE